MNNPGWSKKLSIEDEFCSELVSAGNNDIGRWLGRVGVNQGRIVLIGLVGLAKLDTPCTPEDTFGIDCCEMARCSGISIVHLSSSLSSVADSLVSFNIANFARYNSATKRLTVRWTQEFIDIARNMAESAAKIPKKYSLPLKLSDILSLPTSSAMIFYLTTAEQVLTKKYNRNEIYYSVPELQFLFGVPANYTLSNLIDRLLARYLELINERKGLGLEIAFSYCSDLPNQRKYTRKGQRVTGIYLTVTKSHSKPTR